MAFQLIALGHAHTGLWLPNHHSPTYAMLENGAAGQAEQDTAGQPSMQHLCLVGVCGAVSQRVATVPAQLHLNSPPLGIGDKWMNANATYKTG